MKYAAKHVHVVGSAVVIYRAYSVALAYTLALLQSFRCRHLEADMNDKTNKFTPLVYKHTGESVSVTNTGGCVSLLYTVCVCKAGGWKHRPVCWDVEYAV